MNTSGKSSTRRWPAIVAPPRHRPYDLPTALSMRAHHAGIVPSPTCEWFGHPFTPPSRRARLLARRFRDRAWLRRHQRCAYLNLVGPVWRCVCGATHTPGLARTPVTVVGRTLLHALDHPRGPFYPGATRRAYGGTEGPMCGIEGFVIAGGDGVTCERCLALLDVPAHPAGAWTSPLDPEPRQTMPAYHHVWQSVVNAWGVPPDVWGGTPPDPDPKLIRAADVRDVATPGRHPNPDCFLCGDTGAFWGAPCPDCSRRGLARARFALACYARVVWSRRPWYRLWFRAGWPPSRGSWLDNGGPRRGRWWVRVGPYVIGTVWRWDESDAP